MNQPITVTYSLEEVLGKLNDNISDFKQSVNKRLDDLQKDVDQKFDTLQKDVVELKIEITELKAEMTQVKSDVQDLKSNQRTQIWALIVLLVGAFVKFGFFPNP